MPVRDTCQLGPINTSFALIPEASISPATKKERSKLESRVLLYEIAFFNLTQCIKKNMVICTPITPIDTTQKKNWWYYLQFLLTDLFQHSLLPFWLLIRLKIKNYSGGGQVWKYNRFDLAILLATAKYKWAYNIEQDRQNSDYHEPDMSKWILSC